MKISCKRCNPTEEFEVPSFSAQEKQELLEMIIHSPVKAVKMLINQNKTDHRNAKFIVAHLNLEVGKCSRCKTDNLHGEYVTCPKCNTLNFNWRIEIDNTRSI